LLSYYYIQLKIKLIPQGPVCLSEKYSKYDLC